jgi:hypothetical protein
VLGLVEEERRGCRSGDEVEWWLTASFSISVVFFRFFSGCGVVLLLFRCVLD